MYDLLLMTLSDLHQLPIGSTRLISTVVFELR